jgi:hypothetical protein
VPLVVSPLALMQRMAALKPRPRLNLTGSADSRQSPTAGCGPEDQFADDADTSQRPMQQPRRTSAVWQRLGLTDPTSSWRLFERLVPMLADHTLAHLVENCSICDGLITGLKHPHGPLDPWDGLKRLALMVVQHTAAPPKPPQPRLRLTLQGAL